MIKRNILDCMTLVGGTPSRYEGEKTYVSTGAVDCDHVDYAQAERVTYDNRPSRANLSVAEGDILFAKMCGTKKTLRIDRPLSEHLYSTGFCAVRANESIMDAALLYHLLASDQFLTQKDQNSSGATQKAITNAGLRNIVIQVPDLSEQRMLAANLDCIEQLMAKRREQLVSFDQLVKSRFIELFGDPLKNDKDFPTILGETLFKLSNGRALPNNKRFTVGIPAYGGNGISWYTDEILCDYDTVIIGRVGFQSGNVHLAKAPLWVTDNAMYISWINNKEYDIRFLCSLMEHIDFKRYQDAGDLKKITQKPFMQMYYLMPPLSLQKQYIAFVEQTDKSKYYSAIIYRKSGEPYCRSEKRSICIYKIFSRCSIWFPITYRIA